MIKHLNFNKFINHDILIKILFFSFLIIKSVYLILKYGNSTPYWDQWDAEALNLYLPFTLGEYKFSELFSLHNEHRIFTTRLLALVIFIFCDQVWDPELEMIVNCIIYATAVTLFLSRFIRSDLNILSNYYFIFLSGLFFLIPFGWENALSGFQSQFYFLILFSIQYLWGMTHFRVYSGSWWLSLLCGVLAGLSMASGVLVIITGIFVLAIKNHINQKKKNFSSIFVIFIISLIFLFTTPNISSHDFLKAHTLSDFTTAFISILSWPLKRSLLGFIVYLPSLIWLTLLLRNIIKYNDFSIYLFGLILWFFLNFIAISYGRSVAPLASRYADIYIMGVVLNLYLIFSFKSVIKNRTLYYFIKYLWLIILIYGLIIQAKYIFIELNLKHSQSIIQENNVRDYLCTRNFAFLANQGYLDIPYPSPKKLQLLLDDENIRSFLPESLLCNAHTN